MMEKNLSRNLNNKKKYLFLSMKSDCLKYFKDCIVVIPNDDTETTNMKKLSFDYKTVLGMNLLRFTSFENTGFFDEQFDVTFSFGMRFLLQQEYFDFDSDGLKKSDMADLEFLMKQVIRRRGKFEYSDEMFLEKIDLNKSAGILFYSKEAKNNVKSAGLDKTIIKFDLVKQRAESMKEYQTFDEKIKSGKLQEFEWS